MIFLSSRHLSDSSPRPSRFLSSSPSCPLSLSDPLDPQTTPNQCPFQLDVIGPPPNLNNFNFPIHFPALIKLQYPPVRISIKSLFPSLSLCYFERSSASWVIGSPVPSGKRVLSPSLSSLVPQTPRLECRWL